ncbi:MAG: undecaprenyl-diphosphate phosphatase [Acidimicrobiia bacterium]|nr:undecaprenyl-diphosphate phosphatase [Acidimicrobiia bacterium]
MRDWTATATATATARVPAADTAAHRAGRLGVAAMLAALVVLLSAVPAMAAPIVAVVHTGLGVGQAIVLGLVEGITEYLPISSTGHLLVTSRLLDLPHSGKAGDALKSYEIAIQSGAIVAVLGLYRHRFTTMIEGITKKSIAGRELLMGLAIAFVPAAVVGLVGEKVIKKHLFGVGPVIGAWAVGGVLILVLVARGLLTKPGGRPLEALTSREAAIIGIAQVAALWPGTSRSLVTIVAALLLGLSMSAAIEFSFLLGVLTLGAATAYSVVKDGSAMVDSFGLLTPLIGLVVAFGAAVVSVRWMVTYLQKHSLAIFGWYRIGVAAIALVLLATNVI